MEIDSAEECKRKGGHIRTATGPSKHWGLAADEYMYVCWIKGEAHRGPVHKKKKESEKE